MSKRGSYFFLGFTKNISVVNFVAGIVLAAKNTREIVINTYIWLQSILLQLLSQVYTLFHIDNACIIWKLNNIQYVKFHSTNITKY